MPLTHTHRPATTTTTTTPRRRGLFTRRAPARQHHVTTTHTTTTRRRGGMFGGGRNKRAVVHHHKRKPTMKDKVSGALLKLKGSLTHRPAVKAAGTRRMHGTDGRGSRRVHRH